MKVGLIVPSLAPVGPVLVARTIVEGLVKHGVAVIVYYFDDCNDRLAFRCETKKIKYLSAEPFKECNIVHTHGLRPDIYSFVYKCLLCRARTVTTLHARIFEDLRYDYGLIVSVAGGIAWMLSLVNKRKIVVLNDAMKEYYRRLFLKKPLLTIFNASPVDGASPELTEESRRLLAKARRSKFVLGIVARLIPRKGIDQVIQVLLRMPDYSFVIVGDGPEMGRLKELSQKLKLEDRISFLGSQARGSRFIPFFDFAILPSYSEGFPLFLIEAVSVGLPVVCSRIPSLSSVFKETEVAFFNPGEPDSLEEAIGKVTDNPDYYRQASSGLGRKYSIEAMTESYLDLYRSL